MSLSCCPRHNSAKRWQRTTALSSNLTMQLLLLQLQVMVGGCMVVGCVAVGIELTHPLSRQAAMHQLMSCRLVPPCPRHRDGVWSRASCSPSACLRFLVSWRWPASGLAHPWCGVVMHVVQAQTECERLRTAEAEAREAADAWRQEAAVS